MSKVSKEPQISIQNIDIGKDVKVSLVFRPILFVMCLHFAVEYRGNDKYVENNANERPIKL